MYLNQQEKLSYKGTFMTISILICAEKKIIIAHPGDWIKVLFLIISLAILEIFIKLPVMKLNSFFLLNLVLVIVKETWALLGDLRGLRQKATYVHHGLCLDSFDILKIHYEGVQICIIYLKLLHSANFVLCFSRFCYSSTFLKMLSLYNVFFQEWI